jgi:hypothetical protein
MDRASLSAFQQKASPFAIILGTNEIAAAVAVQLCRTGWSTVPIHDPKVLELVASIVSRTTLQDRTVLLKPRTRAGDVPPSE